MLVQWIPARLHGWLDEVATASYLGAAFFVGIEGLAFWILLFGAALHFTNTRLTDYPQGQLKAYSLVTHAKIELGEGLIMLAAALLPALTLDQRLTFVVFGVSQLAAAIAGDTRLPEPARAEN